MNKEGHYSQELKNQLLKTTPRLNQSPEMHSYQSQFSRSRIRGTIMLGRTDHTHV